MENWLQYLSMHPLISVILGIILLSSVIFIIKKLIKIALVVLLVLGIGLLFTYRKSKSKEFLQKLKKKSEAVKKEVMEEGQKKMEDLKEKALEEGKERLKDK